MNIRIVKREDIDKVKWNSCVHYAEKGNPFGYLWFLDNISKDWFGIVEDDYLSVMPVFIEPKFWKRKLFATPNLLPFFQLYSVNVLSERRIGAFLKLAIEHSNGLRLSNVLVGLQYPEKLGLKQNNRKSTMLKLGQSYTNILNRFSKEMQDLEHDINLDKYTLSSIKIEDLADFMAKTHRLSEKDKFTLMRLFYNAQQRQLGQVFALKDTDGKILAADFVFLSHGRMIPFLPSSAAKGLKIGAEKIIYTRLLKRFAEQPLKFYIHPKSTLSHDFSQDLLEIPVFDLKK